MAVTVVASVAAARAACTANIAYLDGLWRMQRSRTRKAQSIQHGLHRYSTSSSRYISTSSRYAVHMLNGRRLLRRRKRSPKPVTCCNQRSRTCGVSFANSTVTNLPRVANSENGARHSPEIAANRANRKNGCSRPPARPGVCRRYVGLKRWRICGTTSHQLMSFKRLGRTRSIRAFQLHPASSGSCRHRTTLKSLRLECLASCSPSCKSSATMSIGERATYAPRLRM
jgi:hypothetical protein